MCQDRECNQQLGKGKTLVRPVRKVKEKRTIRKPRSQAQSRVTADNILYSGHSQPTKYVIRSGHTVKKPVRLIQDFHEVIHEGPSLKGGEVVQTHVIPWTTVKAHERNTGII